MFGRSEQVDRPDPGVRFGHPGRQSGQQPPAETGHRVPVEQVGGVGEFDGDALGLLPEHDVEVELGDGLPGTGEREGVEAGKSHGVLAAGAPAQHRLHQRVTGQSALRAQFLDDPVERDILVPVGVQVGAAHPVEEFPEGGIARGVRTQHQRVDEETDQLLQGLVVAPGDHGADREIGARPAAGEG
ncbi:hypothetical protein GA0115246_113159, partial [Streptomyces sp. SolWspMP-sol7th]